MNQQTRSLKGTGFATKVGKGINTGNDSGVSNAISNEALTFVAAPVTKGVCVDSHTLREKSGRKPWKGCGDPLGRKK